jgi:hypothetical protein
MAAFQRAISSQAAQFSASIGGGSWVCAVPLTTFVMTYAVTKGMTNVGIEGADARARKVLAEYGFSVLTEIDVKATTTSSYEKSGAVLRSAPSTRWRRCRQSRTPN